jgi:phage-related protein
MALNTFAPPVRQSPGTKIKPTIKTKVAEFGDGYTAELPDGLRHIRDSVDLTWDTLLPEDAIAIEAFLRGQKGVTPFYYDVDEGDVRRWTCKVWERGKADVHSVTATFVEYFGPLV